MTLAELFNERSFQPRLPVTISADGGPVDVATLDLDTGRYERVSPLTDGDAAARALVLLRSGGWPVGLEELDLVAGFDLGRFSRAGSDGTSVWRDNEHGRHQKRRG